MPTLELLRYELDLRSDKVGETILKPRDSGDPHQRGLKWRAEIQPHGETIDHIVLGEVLPGQPGTIDAKPRSAVAVRRDGIGERQLIGEEAIR